jgi:hypothetical protein
MRGYVCKQCPLAFEIGSCIYWGVSGGYDQLVCRHCGTMHRVEFLEGQPDMLFAVSGPVRAMVEKTRESGKTHTRLDVPITKESWQPVGPLPPADMRLSLDAPGVARAAILAHLPCAHCGGIGGLVSLEWPLGPDGGWPCFGNNCPVCGGDIECAYHLDLN